MVDFERKRPLSGKICVGQNHKTKYSEILATKPNKNHVELSKAKDFTGKVLSAEEAKIADNAKKGSMLGLPQSILRQRACCRTWDMEDPASLAWLPEAHLLESLQSPWRLLWK
jgi:hypothetical protein